MKTIIKAIIKLSVAIAILYWLQKSGKIDTEFLMQSFQRSPVSWILAFLLAPAILFAQALRWQILLKIKGLKKLNLKDIYIIDWIGMFFNSFLPGSVSGDFVKIFYIKKIEENLSTRFLLGSIFIDRLMGLASLISMVAISNTILLFSYKVKNQSFYKITLINYGLFFSMLVAVLILFWFKEWPKRLSHKRFQGKLSFVLSKLEFLWIELSKIKKILPKLLLLSIIAQAFYIVIFWMLTSFIDQNLDLLTYFVLAPPGFFTMAIPLGPSGMGVSHLAFQELFQLFGIKEGANIFNIYFIFVLTMNLTGAIPYILKRSERPKNPGLN